MATEYFNDAWRIPNNKNQSLVSNYSMEFDGTSDFITISNPTELTDDFTIAAWIYPTRVDNSYEMIYTQGDGTVPAYFAVKDTKLHVYITGIYETGLNFITADEWQHVAVTRTSGVLNLYRNGIEYNGSRPTQNGTINTNNPGVIGKWYNSSNTFKGKIDQTCIFDYALPASGTNSIATLYGGGTAVTNPMSLSPKPVAYYQLGDQTASNNTTEPTPPVQSYLVPNNSLQDYVFNFDGSNEIELRNSSSTDTSLNLSPDASVSAWIYKTNVNVYGAIYSNSRGNSGYFGFQLLVTNLNKLELRCNLKNNVKTSTATVPNNEWVHVAATYKSGSSSEIKLSINGVVETFTPGYVEPINYTNPAVSSGVVIGEGLGIFAFIGEISNVSLFDSVLTSAQITTIYNNGSPNDISSLSPVSWWKLNAQDTFDGNNWTIKDYAGSNDGTSSGMTSANLVQSNLQHTSGFSPYALSLDSNDANYFTLNNGGGNGLLNAATSLTISAWINIAATETYHNIFTRFFGGVMFRVLGTNGNLQLYLTREDNTYILIQALNAVSFNEWQHLAATWDGSTVKLYVNNVEVKDVNFSDTLKNDTSNNSDLIGNRVGTLQYFNGKMSNVAVWKNSVIDVNTLYNQGVPADLTSLNPSGWWQMGSNSSFDANTSKWTCLNEGTARTSTVPSNATTFAGNMTEDDITNGVGYSANGLGTSSIEIIGDAPYSTANGISENMDVLDRTTDVPS